MELVERFYFTRELGVPDAARDSAGRKRGIRNRFFPRPQVSLLRNPIKSKADDLEALLSPALGGILPDRGASKVPRCPALPLPLATGLVRELGLLRAEIAKLRIR
jgi:hypothetical protein